MNGPTAPGSLRACLAYEPPPLRFGTSGRRGDVIHLTQLEIHLNALAELEYLQSLPRAAGGIVMGAEFFFARDLRPSSSRFVPEQGGRGEIAQAIERAIRDAGMKPVNLGLIPTPALTFHALQRGRGSMMITGSHIPFDRNGYKTNSAKGELLKQDEAPINRRVEQVRARLYGQPFGESLFNERGMFKAGHQELSEEITACREAYLQRYLDFFAGRNLIGRKLLVYQHSAVGRDLLVEMLERFGAQVIPAGRSDTFVPIDTENIDAEQLGKIQALANDACAAHGPIDAVVSIDGDSDRPLVLGSGTGVLPVGQDRLEARSHYLSGLPCQVHFFGGDLVGMIVAEFLGADAVVVPISCNDAVDRGALKDIVEPKTRIGSPFVIAGMEKARAKGRGAVCGWEANGGFLTGSDIVRDGRVLRALPTRDAFLPILCVLFAMAERKCSMTELFARLPKRHSRAALLKNFPRATSLRIVEQFSPADPRVREVVFQERAVVLLDEKATPIPATENPSQALRALRESLGRFFTPDRGFGGIERLNYTDGVRILFSNGDVAHVRPSGNADELRIYAVADTQARADAIAQAGIEEPDGILRRLQQAVTV
jgi:phosphomannomutase